MRATRSACRTGERARGRGELASPELLGRVARTARWRRLNNSLAAWGQSRSGTAMEERAPASTALAEPGKSHRHGRSPLIVGSYVGELAGEAAQAVRRAGLKPGLERTFGYEPHELGQVVAQQPASGGELARNGLVTLYVAAPGDEDIEQRACEPVGEPSTLAHDRAAPASERDAKIPRPRKPGRAAREARAVDPPPAPWTRNSQEQGEAVTEVAGAYAAEDRREQAPAMPDEPASELEEIDTSELVVHAEELFAGRAASTRAGRRHYPPRARGPLRTRAAEHPWLVGTAGALLALWLIVALASALGGHARQSNPSRPRSDNYAALGSEKTPAPRASWPHSSPGAPHPQGTRKARVRTRRTRRPSERQGDAAAAPLDRASHAPAHTTVPSPTAGGSVRASATAARERDPRNGGPFSP